MLESLLPIEIIDALRELNFSYIYELRLRKDAPIVINYRGENKVVFNQNKKLLCSESMINHIMAVATENSLYAYNNQIKQGFITTVGGIRIGIAGESVMSDKFMPTTLKNITSLNIRVPHEVKGCSNLVCKFIINDLKNTLLISPPGAGKTTILRDIARQISLKTNIHNCLIVDERYEICSVVDGKVLLDVGEFSDVISGSTKNYAFDNGIRALRPDVILTDELIDEDDAIACVKAINSGVKVIATIHGNNISEVKEKKEFAEMINKQCFERYVVLSCKNGPGSVEGIYDKNFNCLYF